jgi:hypothetical protein
MMIGDNADDMEIALIEQAHNMAMSHDPDMAIRGRYLKAVGLPVLRWIEEERKRVAASADSREALLALIHGHAQSIAQDISTLHANLSHSLDVCALGMTTQASLIVKYVSQAIESRKEVDCHD